MARCGCAGSSGCSCVVVSGIGTQVYGSGTSSDPYVIDATGTTISGALDVVDTPSVDLEMSGSGTVADPYIISAEATLSIEDLIDAPTGTPDAGDVIIWDGSQWVYGPPETGGAGSPILTANGLSGTGVTGDPAVANTSGVWGTAPLNTYGSDSLNGAPIYVDSAGNLRSQPLSVTILAAGATRPTQYRGRVIIQDGAPYYSDGSNWLPLQLDIAYDWSDVCVTDTQVQDDGLPVYYDTDGKLRAPRGVLAWAGDTENGYTQDYESCYWNPVSVLLGSVDDPTFRHLTIARADTADATNRGFTSLYSTWSTGRPAAALKSVRVLGGGTPDENEAGVIFLRSDGQILVATAGPSSPFTSRPVFFAQQMGTVALTGAANEVRSTVVTLSVGRFTDTPRVFMQPITGTTNPSTTNNEHWPSDVTSSSFQANLNRSNGTAVSLWWLAVQQEAPTPTSLAMQQARSAAGLVAAEVSAVADGTATCFTAGCPAYGVGVGVTRFHTDEHGASVQNTSFTCGECWLPITHVTAGAP